MKRLIFIVPLLVVIVIAALSVRAAFDSNRIGVVEVIGAITDSKETIKNIKSFSENKLIRVIILRVDSPGGIVAPSQEIYEAVKKARESKKVVASMGALAASGGYLIAAPADLIVANPGTLTGSIGVLMEFVNVEKLMDKLGVSMEVIKSKEHKDIGSPFRTMTGKEKEMLQGVIADVYDQFVEVVSAERGIPQDSVVKFADGRIFTGRQAKELGLVDTLGSFEDAVTIAKDLVGIKVTPRLIYPKKKRSLMNILFEPMDRLLLPKIQYIFKMQ